MHYSSFKFHVMHYGLTNAPASFQWFMNNIFKDLLDICVVVYLDNILIYSENPTNHTAHIQEVLHCLCTNNLYAKVNKCEFSIRTMNFLGFIISPNGLQMDKAKVQVIQDWPQLKKVKEVQSFLGFANSYCHSIMNNLDLTVPLTWLTQRNNKNSPWHWSPACSEAFGLLKLAFTTSTHPYH